MKIRNLLVLVIITCSGCANNVYFGTSTRLAIDFSSDTAGIGYKNSQVAFVPPKEDDSGHSILGKSDVDISMDNIVIDEEFATGLAAECASENTPPAAAIAGAPSPSYGNLIFGSYNSISIIDINFGATNPFAGATFGYKRATATVVPIKNDFLRSVYAKTKVNTLDHSASETHGTRTGGIRFVQEFATGKASVHRAAANVASLTGGNKTTACTP